ncbi:MAG: hypothetical protein JWP91_3182 [Fibrobacteres bacterium]|nr:hypothetical protein [Fibrobacterota bacterium]
MNSLLGALGAVSFATGLCVGQSQILSQQYREFPHVLPGVVVKLEKVLDPETGEIQIRKGGLPFSKSDMMAWEHIENQARLGRIGRLSEELEDRRSQMGSSEAVRVVVHAKYPPILYPDKTKSTLEAQLASSKAAAALPPVAGLDVLKLRHGMFDCEESGSGMATCTVTSTQLETLKADDEVGSVELFHEERGTSVELSTLANSAYNPGSVPSGAGYGVHAATFEYGLNSTFVSCLGVPVTYDVSTIGDQMGIRHTQTSFKSLVMAAPSATFYHRKSTSFDGVDDVNYLINNGIQTVSMSMSRGGTSPYHTTQPEYLVMDDFAYRYPYPVFVNPSDNNGYQYETNWQCYNAISVGNVRHTNLSTYELADCTQTKNPPPIYGSCISGSGASCAGDREMPHVVVPGIPGTGTDFTPTCIGGAGTIGCGTSWSAPIGNGMAADVIAADSRMSGWPEKVRATLILTAQNVDGGYQVPTTDGRDGSGVVSGSEAVAFASGHTSVSIGNSAVEKGMTAGSFYAADLSSGTKRFNYSVPNPKPSGKHLRAVLTWDSNPIVGGAVNALSDLDLTVQKNGGVQGSYSWDGNVEVVDVAAADLTAGGSYYIDIAPSYNRIPASGSRANFIYYAIAWTWVKDHAN